MKTSHTQQSLGFTLVELLTVMTIIAIIASFSIVAFQHISSSTHLTTAAAQISSQMNLARQLATSRNRVSEIRLFIAPADAADATTFRGIIGSKVLVDFDGDGTFAEAEAATSIEWFPGDVVADDEATRSSLVQSMTVRTIELPGRGPFSYLALRFRPDGSPIAPSGTTIPAAWGLLVAARRDLVRTSTSGLPDNFILFSMSPTSGRIRHFQP